MKSIILNLVTLLLIPAALVFFTSCSATPPGEATSTVAFQEGVPGLAKVETYTETATVTGIDAANRKVTLVGPDGKKTPVKCGPEVINFDQIRVGDQLKVTVVKELVVYLAQAGSASDSGAAAVVALSPKGAKPGGIMANTVQITARVAAIDIQRHAATLLFPDGSTRTYEVRPDVDLTRRQVGEEVVIRATEALVILVEKP